MKKRGIWLGIVACLVLAAGLVVQRWSPARAQPQPQVAMEFLSASYAVGEADGTVTLTVTLSQSSSSTVTVDYSTSDGTAVGAPQDEPDYADYARIDGTLVFAPGETSKTIVVSIIDSTCCEPSEVFFVVLGNPVGGSLGTSSTATVTIADDDACP